MTSVLKVLKELESSKSSNFKLEVLKKFQEHDDLKEFFRLSIDKQISFYIRKIPSYNTVHAGVLSLAEAMQGLSVLSERLMTGNNAISYLSDLLSKTSEDDAEIIIRIMNKDPGCGVSVNSVNKIWNDLIEEWPVHLCERPTDKNFARIVYPAIIQEKADGVRINIIYYNGKIEYRTRSGNLIVMFNKLDNETISIAKHIGGNFVIDGEALVVDNNGNIMDRKTGNGIINKAIQGTISEEEADMIVVRMWDIIPYDEFRKGEGTTNYNITINKIVGILSTNTFRKLSMTHTELVDDHKQALQFYYKMLGLGKEGAVLKNQNSKWENGRSIDNVKMKLKEPLDLKVVDTYDHKKKKGWIGGLVVESSDGKLRVNVGSGLTDEDRQQPASYYVGKIVIIESNGIMSANGRTELSLFLPIYKEVRYDKNTADSLNDIQNIFSSFLTK